MMETIKSIAYAEGFLKALGAVMQDREMTNETPGRITTETQYAANRLRSVEAFVKGMDCMIDSRNKEAEKYEAEIAELKAHVEALMLAASERTEQIAKWINAGATPTGNPGEYVVVWKCSNCGKIITEAKAAYCPGCGARMEVGGDGELTKQGYDMIMDRVTNLKITPPQNLTIIELKRWMEGHADAQASILGILEQMKDSNGR